MSHGVLKTFWCILICCILVYLIIPITWNNKITFALDCKSWLNKISVQSCITICYTYIKTNLKSNIFLQNWRMIPFNKLLNLQHLWGLNRTWRTWRASRLVQGWISSWDVGKDIRMYPPWNYCWWFRNPTNSPVEGTVVTIPLLFFGFYTSFPGGWEWDFLKYQQ